MVCGVCLDRKDQRLAVLSEQNREINLSRGRILHCGRQTLSIGLSRDDLVQRLTTITTQRRALMDQVQLQELWSLLEGEERCFGAAELAEYIFAGSLTDDHVAAVLRVMLTDRLYLQIQSRRIHPTQRRAAPAACARNKKSGKNRNVCSRKVPPGCRRCGSAKGLL